MNLEHTLNFIENLRSELSMQCFEIYGTSIIITVGLKINEYSIN